MTPQNKTICPECKGVGEFVTSHRWFCPKCKGIGEIFVGMNPPKKIVAFLVTDEGRLCLTGYHGICELVFAKYENSQEFYKNVTQEVWKGTELPGDKIQWSLTQTIEYTNLKKQRKGDNYYSYDNALIKIGNKIVTLSDGKTLEPHHITASEMAETRKQELEAMKLDMNDVAGLLKDHAATHPSKDLRSLLLKYKRSQECSDPINIVLRMVEETEGKLVYREQQECVLRHLGGFTNHNHMPVILKAIGKKTAIKLAIYKELFLANNWVSGKENAIAIWNEVSADLMPNYGTLIINLSQKQNPPGWECLGFLPDTISEKKLPKGFIPDPQKVTTVRDMTPEEIQESYKQATNTNICVSINKEYHTDYLPENPKYYASLSGNLVGCVFKDTMLDQTLEITLENHRMLNYYYYLDIVAVQNGVVKQGYRYHGLSRVSGNKFRYEKIEDLPNDFSNYIF